MKYLAYTKVSQTRFSGFETKPDGWEVRRLKFAATCNDEALSETTDPDYEMVYVDISSVDLVNGIMNTETLHFEEAPSRARRIVKDGDTIISTVRTYLKAIAPVKEPPENMIVSTGFAVVRPHEAVDSRFLGYALQSIGFIGGVVANSTGVSYPAINPTTLVSLPVGYPVNKNEQRQIAAFLDWKTKQIDALLARKRELLEKLSEKRLAIITRTVTRGLNPAAPLRDSGIPWLGQVPKHWEVKKLKFIGEPFIGLTYDPDEVVDEKNGTLVLRANNILDGRLIGDEPVFVSTKIPECLRLIVGDILICSRNGSRHLIGKNGLVTAEFAGATFGAFNTVFRSEANGFLYWVFNSCLFEFQSGSYLTSTINQLTISTLSSIVVPLPPSEERVQIESYLEAKTEKLDSLVLKTQSAIERLTEYRTALITAATTGKIDVRGVKIPDPGA